MTRKGTAGGWGLSARFLAWARSNGHADLIDDVARARSDYKSSGANTARYEELSDQQLEEAGVKAGVRLDRLMTEKRRRGDQSGGGVVPDDE